MKGLEPDQVMVLKRCFDGFADEDGAIPADNVGNILSLMGMKVRFVDKAYFVCRRFLIRPLLNRKKYPKKLHKALEYLKLIFVVFKKGTKGSKNHITFLVTFSIFE